MQYKLIVFIAFLISISTTQAQSYKEHRGDVYFSRFNYNKAIERYQAVLEKEPDNEFVHKKLAQSYKYIAQYDKSVIYYTKIYNKGRMETQDLYDYQVVLKSVGEYDRAGKILMEYEQRTGSQQFLLNDEFVKGLTMDEFMFKVRLVENSSEQMDFAPSWFGDKLVFVSSRQGTDILHPEYERDGQAYLQLYVADPQKNGQLENIQLMAGSFNTRFHEGPVSYCPADSTMYFTRNNYKLFKQKSRDGQLKLNIYTAQFSYQQWKKSVSDILNGVGIKNSFKDEMWRRTKEFPHNSSEYSYGHPTVTPDGNRIYFVSDRPGGEGGTDIYYCERIGKNSWTHPVNIRDINSAGNEMFPYIHPTGVLFFASDGHPGLGGMDIFSSEPDGNKFKEPQNMGSPVNSKFDDFGLIADEETKIGYFSSNRHGGKGSDDLYYVEFLGIPQLILAGTVRDKATGKALPGAKLSFDNLTDTLDFDLIADNNGKYAAKVTYTHIFDLVASQHKYLSYNQTLNTKYLLVKNDTLFYDIELDKEPEYGIYGNVFIKDTKEPVPQVKFEAVPDRGDIIALYTDNKGNFRTKLQEDMNYELFFTKKDFFTIREKYSTKGRVPGYINLNEFVELAIEKIEVNKTIEIPNIYYDLGKWNIRTDAAVELDKVVTFLSDNPDIQIELGSHTDARGSAKSNQRLSQKRAQSAVNYIVSKGIDKTRITAKGYGEQKIKNRCIDGVKCSEEEHQANRRTEIKITSF
jgi:outer membrane protein OmpA-like peptidoglycan-associated protein/tetratricopeptide (TPR) repeat protein